MTSDIHCQEEYIYYHDVHMHVDIYQPRYFKGTIIILHGLIANGRMLSFLAVPFYRLGYRVICPDLPFLVSPMSNKRPMKTGWLVVKN